MLKLHQKAVRRTYQCDMPGCRNRSNLLVSRRMDISAKPMHICDQCIVDLFVARGLSIDAEAVPSGPEVPTLAPAGGLEVNGGLAAVAKAMQDEPDEIDTFDPMAGLPPDEPKQPEQKEEPKPEPKKTAPKGGRKPGTAAKTSGKAKTGGKA